MMRRIRPESGFAERGVGNRMVNRGLAMERGRNGEVAAMHIRTILCALGFHAPSVRSAWQSGKNYRSVCRHCDQPMKRIDADHWAAETPVSLNGPAIPG